MNENIPKYPLSYLYFNPHFFGASRFDAQRDGSLYTPDMLKKAYGFPENRDASGMRVAVISAFDDGEVTENLRTFTNEFGLEMPKVNLHYPNGKPIAVSRSWQIETALDTQWLSVFAPKAEIDVVFSKTALLDDMVFAVRYAVTIGAHCIAMCFGTREFASQEEMSAVFENSSSIFVCSSGDNGGIVEFPSSSPHVLSVGGTRLILDGNSKIISETVWQNSGGGSSRIFTIPDFQKSFVPSLEKMRSSPDVAFSADLFPGAAVFVSSLGGWTNAGGTSLGCACVTGICTLIKKYNQSIDSTRDLQNFLYVKAGQEGYDIPQFNFRDIVIGQSGDFTAKEGWDFCTGLGSLRIGRFLLK